LTTRFSRHLSSWWEKFIEDCSIQERQYGRIPVNRNRLFAVAVTLILGLLPCAGLPQSKDHAVALWNEAWQIESNAKSRQELEQAARKYELALAAFEKIGDQEKMWCVATNLGKINCVLGDYNKGRDYYQKAVDVATKIGSTAGQAQGQSGLGGVAFDLGQFDKAIDHYRQALQAYRTSGNTEWEALTLNHIGEVHREKGQYAKAVEYYQQALDMSRKIGSPEGQADTLHNMGEVSRLQGQYSTAMKHYSKSLEIYRTLGDRLHEGIALTNIGNVYFERGQHDHAVDSYLQALAVLKQGGMLREEARTILNLGRIQQAGGKREEAEASLQKGFDLYRKIGVDVSRPAKLLGDFYLDMGDLEKANTFINQVNSSALSGRLYLIKKQFEQAAREYAKLLKSAEVSGNVEDLFTAHTGLGRVYEALEDYQKAASHYAKGMEMTEEIRSALLPSERQNFFEVRINGFARSDPAKGLTRVQMKLNESAESIAPSEATRARAFADRVSQRRNTGYSGAPQDVLSQEQALMAKVAALKKTRSKVPKDRNTQRYDELTRDVNKAEAEFQAFVDTLWKEHTAYAAIKYPRPVTLRESALRPGEHVIMFDVSDERVGAKLIIGKETASTFSTVYPIAELESDVRQFCEFFVPGRLRQFDPQLGKKLYSKLLAPVLTEVPKGTPLIIIPHEILAVLPFEALVVSGNVRWKRDRENVPEGLTYLADLYPISYYQSITALTLVRTLGENRKAGDRLLVIADPVFQLKDERAQAVKQTDVASKDEESVSSLMTAIEEIDGGSFKFRRLPETSVLAANLQNLYGSNAERYTDLRANKADFLKDIAPRLDQYTAVVFATHGVFSTRVPGMLEPFLALTMVPPGTDGFLRMSDVMSLKMNADIVALTACRTGLGKQVSGEGMTSMGRAFQCAGAKSVLMTLWSVSEEPSVQLVEHFFQHLKAGKNKLEALTLARSELRQAGYQHPYYWAPFILVGETR